jgi:hypothetical protein
MNTYKSRPHPSVYRKIYEENYGAIPKDEQGRSYHIHHKDHNPFNNDPTNLEAISVSDHLTYHNKNQVWTEERRKQSSYRCKIDNPARRPGVGAKISVKCSERNARLVAEGKHVSQTTVVCPHCNISYKGNAALSNHIKHKH